MFRYCVIAASLLLVSLVAACASGADLVLRDRVEPADAIVRLGDLAEVRALDLAEADRLSALPMMPTPAPGAEQHVRAEAIRELLHALGEPLSAHRLGGPPAVTVVGPSKTPTPTEKPTASRPAVRALATMPRAPRRVAGFRLATPSTPSRARTRTPRPLNARDRASLAERLAVLTDAALAEAGLGERLETRAVELTGVADDALRGLHDAAADPASFGRADLAPGRYSVRFRGPNANVRLQVTLGPVRRMLMVTTPVRRGETLTAASLTTRRVPRDAKRLPSDPVVELEEVVGLVAARSLREGEFLPWAACVQPILVRRGDAVSVSTGVAGVTVRAPGVAKQDGRRGDVVPVELYGGRETLNATVTGRGELAVLGASADGRVAAFPREEARR